MCHFLLLLPLLTLPVFWILPLGPATLIYGTSLALSAAIYWYAIQAMRRPVQTGAAGMLGEVGEVTASNGSDLFVRARSEVWRAECSAKLLEGERVRVIELEGLTLRVQKLDASPAGEGADAAPKPPGGMRAQLKVVR